jgi:hypothetical protein
MLGSRGADMNRRESGQYSIVQLRAGLSQSQKRCTCAIGSAMRIYRYTGTAPQPRNLRWLS